MKEKSGYYPIIAIVVVLIAFSLNSCGIQVTKRTQVETTSAEVTISLIASGTPKPSSVLTPTKTPRPSITWLPSYTPSSTPTIDPTYQTWQTTAIAIEKTELAARELRRNTEATLVAQFPSACTHVNYQESSPDGNWLASNCSYDEGHSLFIVQNKQGIRWVLDYINFISPDTDVEGHLFPEFWSPDGKNLYFFPALGFSGGGNQCFTHSAGKNGLFRLNLITGSWVTLVPPVDWFPGYIIRFSPTGRRYAVDIHGIHGFIITNLKTEKNTQINAPGLTDFTWSPDGKKLVYFVATCGEELVQTSSVYVWDIFTQKAHILFTTEESLLIPESWTENSILRINGEKWVGQDTLNTIYEYDISKNDLIFTSTATPYP